jgi:nitrous oxidase accessory protein NosD
MKTSLLLVSMSIALSTATVALAQRADISVKSGAVGLEERDAMMAERGQYNLHLAFARNNGEFIADVKVTIRDRNGAVVYEGTADGPYFFAKLPRAAYDVTVDFEGKAQKRRVAVGSGGGNLMYFRWS